MNYPSVDAYLRKAPAFAQPIIEHLLEVVHAAYRVRDGQTDRGSGTPFVRIGTWRRKCAPPPLLLYETSMSALRPERN